MFKLFRIMFKLLRLGGMVFKKKLLIPNAAHLARDIMMIGIIVSIY